MQGLNSLSRGSPEEQSRGLKCRLDGVTNGCFLAAERLTFRETLLGECMSGEVKNWTKLKKDFP